MNTDGGIGTAARVVPAQQRFDADHRAAVGGDNRLIVDVESLQRDRGLKFAQQRAPLGVFGFDLRLEKPHPAAAFAFGRTQRQTGATGHFVGRRAVLGGFRDTDAGGDLPHPVDEDRALQRSTKCIDQRSRGGLFSLLMMTANSSSSKRPSIASAGQSGLQMFGDIHDHGIAAGSPQRIVDLVKAVEIDQRESDDAGTAPRQRVAETLDHGAMIGQSGQRVLAKQIARRFGASIERTQKVARCAHGEKPDHAERDTDGAPAGPKAGSMRERVRCRSPS